ncbi:hypothetical protein ACJW30_07G008300 [Castanea mollissima]
MESGGVHEIVLRSIRRCDMDIRREMFGNLVLSGGTTMIPGLADKLAMDLSSLAPPEVVELNDKDGQVKLTCLGPNLLDNQQPQYTVPPNVWFGSLPTKDISLSLDGTVLKAPPRDGETHFSLVGCTCAPAFQFQDFELAKRSELVSRFPSSEALISLLTFPE